MEMNNTFISIQQMEAATDALLETAAKVGADTWQQRVKNQTPHCKFGEEGICCRICTMGPCRITKKSPRGICGCDADGIVARNYLRFTAGGAKVNASNAKIGLKNQFSAVRDGKFDKNSQNYAAFPAIFRC